MLNLSFFLRISLIRSIQEFKCTMEGINNQISYLQVSKPWMLNTNKSINQKPWKPINQKPRKSINICFCLPSQEICIFEYTTQTKYNWIYWEICFFLENTFLDLSTTLIFAVHKIFMAGHINYDIYLYQYQVYTKNTRFYTFMIICSEFLTLNK